MNRTVRLGGREIARMGLGTNRLSATSGNVEFIRQAATSGIGLIDTAHLYTGGVSETTIGTALDGQSMQVVVATKGGYGRGEGSREVLSGQIAQSLRQLRTDRMFLYYLHRVDPETPLETSVEVLAEHQARGSIENIGLSEVNVEQIERARAIVPIAAVQNHYNLNERRWDDVVDYCTEENIVFVPFFPLRERRPEVRSTAQAHDATTAQITLAWLLHRSPLMLPIPGTLSIEHVRENVAALDIELSPEELVALR